MDIFKFDLFFNISLHIFFSLICQIFQTLRLFKALRLLPTCPTSIPDSRVRVLWASKSILIIQYIKFKVDPGKIRNLSYKTITLLLPDSNAGTMKRKANTLSIDSAGKDARIILFLKLFSQRKLLLICSQKQLLFKSVVFT